MLELDKRGAGVLAAHPPSPGNRIRRSTASATSCPQALGGSILAHPWARSSRHHRHCGSRHDHAPEHRHWPPEQYNCASAPACAICLGKVPNPMPPTLMVSTL